MPSLQDAITIMMMLSLVSDKEGDVMMRGAA